MYVCILFCMSVLPVCLACIFYRLLGVCFTCMLCKFAFMRFSHVCVFCMHACFAGRPVRVCVRACVHACMGEGDDNGLCYHTVSLNCNYYLSCYLT